jgi:hypothetical protein
MPHGANYRISEPAAETDIVSAMKSLCLHVITRSRLIARLFLGVMTAGMLQWGGPLCAAEPSTSPMLDFETGRHNSAILGISTDSNNRLLATVSRDTARLWDVKTGDQLRIFRPPVSANLGDTLGGVAISPDGKLVAVGGGTGHD